MEVQWTNQALLDIERLYTFLVPMNKPTAVRIVQSLVAAPVNLRMNPRIGEKLEVFMPREVRRILVGQYEMRYEIKDSVIYVLRLWHTREHRRQ